MRQITIGGFDHIKAVTLGGDHSVVIQTMWKDRLSFSDLDDYAVRVEWLGRMGCGLLRFAVPDIAAAEALGSLAKMVSMPLVADIHFDHKIALRCMDFPIAKIRINPGNIGSHGSRGGKEKVRAVLDKAADKSVAIRIGVNAGSLPKDLRERAGQGMDRALALVEAAERELAVFDEFGFTNVVVSMKASNLADTIKANRLLAQRIDTPMHIGVTEAGPLVAGASRSGAALSLLLAHGIGDTLRVSLSDSMENEIIVAREICSAAAEIAAINGDPAGEAMKAMTARLKRTGVNLVSCPRCGRHGFDTHGFCNRWMNRLYALDRTITVAVMGCEVNGPEEARHADIGITGSGGKVLIFRRGVIVRTVTAAEADAAFEEELTKEE
jgi:(E)-4-hydroxy-3-methylbut-2-enyl-diphosphate synthase